MDRLNANSFFALFGEDFKTLVQGKLKADPARNAEMKPFLELGQIRNRLVHQNFVQFDVEKTPEELIQQFRVALAFLTFLREHVFPATEACDI